MDKFLDLTGLKQVWQKIKSVCLMKGTNNDCSGTSLTFPDNADLGSALMDEGTAFMKQIAGISKNDSSADATLFLGGGGFTLNSFPAVQYLRSWDDLASCIVPVIAVGTKDKDDDTGSNHHEIQLQVGSDTYMNINPGDINFYAYQHKHHVTGGSFYIWDDTTNVPLFQAKADSGEIDLASNNNRLHLDNAEVYANLDSSATFKLGRTDGKGGYPFHLRARVNRTDIGTGSDGNSYIKVTPDATTISQNDIIISSDVDATKPYVTYPAKTGGNVKYDYTNHTTAITGTLSGLPSHCTNVANVVLSEEKMADNLTQYTIMSTIISASAGYITVRNSYNETIGVCKSISANGTNYYYLVFKYDSNSLSGLTATYNANYPVEYKPSLAVKALSKQVFAMTINGSDMSGNDQLYITKNSKSMSFTMDGTEGEYPGIQADAAEIEFNGRDIYCNTGEFISSTTSDRRLKDNIVSSDCLTNLKSLGGVYEFDYRKDGKHSVGFIAQEVAEDSVFADIVRDTATREKIEEVQEDGTVKSVWKVKEDATVYKAINYNDPKLISSAIGAILQLEEKIETLQNRVNELEEKLKSE